LIQSLAELIVADPRGWIGERLRLLLAAKYKTRRDGHEVHPHRWSH
jgi:hypothetical protein